MNNCERKYKYDLAVEAMLFWCTLQDFILSIIYKILDNELIVTILLYSKDVILFFLFIYALFTNINLLTKKNKNTIVLFFLLLFSLFLGCFNYGITQSIKSLRSIFIIPEFIVVGYSIKNKKKFFSFLKGPFMNYLVVFSILGLIEYFSDKVYGTINFWKNEVGLTRYFIDIKGEENRLLFGLPGNFYGDYGNGWFSVKRLVSLWVSPLTAGYNLLFPATYYSICFIEKKTWKNFICFFIVFLSFYLTYTRFNLVLFLLAISFFLIKKYKKRADIIILFMIFVVFLLTIFASKIYSRLLDSSTIGHFEAVLNNLSGISIFGSGLGGFGITSGNSTESAVLSFVGQLGIIGFVTFVFFIWFFYSKLFYASKKDNFSVSCFIFITIILMSSIISEQLTAFTSSALPLIILGVYGAIKDNYFIISTSNVKDKSNQCFMITLERN